jgi:hypothetical protein
MRHLTPSLVHRQMNALLLLDDGWAAERVADVLFIDAETVREYRRRYQVGGVAGVEQRKFEGSDPALSPEQLKLVRSRRLERVMDLEPVVCWLGWHRYFDSARFVLDDGKTFMGRRNEPVPRRIRVGERQA